MTGAKAPPEISHPYAALKCRSSTALPVFIFGIHSIFKNTNGLIADDEAVLVTNFSGGCNYTLKDDPQPQVLFTFGLSNLKPAPSSVST